MTPVSTFDLVEALRTTLDMYGLPGRAVSWRIAQANQWMSRQAGVDTIDPHIAADALQDLSMLVRILWARYPAFLHPTELVDLMDSLPEDLLYALVASTGQSHKEATWESNHPTCALLRHLDEVDACDFADAGIVNVLQWWEDKRVDL